MKIENYKLKIVGIVFFSFTIANAVSAATLFIEGSERDALVGELFSINVVLTTLGEQVNAVEGEVLYDRDVLYLEHIREDSSLISLWLERPKQVEEGMVRFSGVIPGGSPSAKTSIVTLVFKPLAAGDARVWFRNARAFLNDGEGTSVPLSFSNYAVHILKDIPLALRIPPKEEEIYDKEDSIPPEEFRPEISRDESVYDGKWFVAFFTRDAISGVDHYEIYEGKPAQISDITSWMRAESPYLLRDQDLKSYIYVKAVDRKGNERVVIVDPQEQSRASLWIIISFVFLVLIVFWKKDAIQHALRG